MLLDLYHKLPHSAQSLVASLHGYYLQSLRYGGTTDALVREAEQRERWSQQQWNSWQAEQLAHLLKHARTTVPFYRKYWDDRARRGDAPSFEHLENWPIVEKAAVREDPKSFVSENVRSKLHLVQTSGTTGTPLQLWQSRQSLIAWYAQVEARSRRWYGVTRNDRWSILGGKLVAPANRKTPPFWVWNEGMRQLYLSSYHLSSTSVPHYVRALREHKVSYLWGYTSSLLTIAQQILEQNLTPPELRVTIANAEPVYAHQREIIEAAFGCSLRETYGMAEMVAAAGECPEGAMHLWPDTGVVEILDDEGVPCASGATGSLVCTGLINRDMPLIRFRTGDQGSVKARGTQCACGRTLPVLNAIEGRVDDVVITPDGRRIGRMDPILKGNIPVRELQFIQDRMDSLRVLYVPASGFQPGSARELEERIRRYVGDLCVSLEPVSQIPRGANGKFRMVVNLIPAGETLARKVGA